MKTLVVFAFILSFALAVRALKCWTCNNEKSNEACLKNGKMTDCQASQQVCETEVRRGSYGMMVTKRCKQRHACMNNHMQNPLAAWEPSQCNEKVPSSVCRCCCTEAKICMESLDCKGKVQKDPCTPIKTNPNVQIKCQDSLGIVTTAEMMPFGTVCEFTCGKGYQLVGFTRSQCGESVSAQTNTSIFDHESPECKESSCPRFTGPANGVTRCTDQNFAGSVCSFTCNSGYVLEGSRSRRCVGETRKWSQPVPDCKPGSCDPQETNPPNGRVRCTKGNSITSVCSLTCDPGYTLDGNPSTTCNANSNSATGGSWSRRIGICRADCPIAVAPANGEVTCTDTNQPGSVCTYTCNNGFYLNVGSSPYPASTTQTCQSGSSSGGGAAWNPSTRIECRPITCAILNAPANGQISCDRGGNTIGSDCTYICNSGYYLSGTGFGASNDKTTCQTTPTSNSDGRGAWSPAPPATCPSIKCPKLSAPPNGTISCAGDGEDIGNDCTYICDSGYFLSGTGFGPSNDKTTCGTNAASTTNGVGVWSPTPPPNCSRDCPVAVAPVNGQVFCNDNNNVGSVCTYSCNDGYVIDNGADPSPATRTQTCERGGSNGSGGASWNPSTPTTCKPITCTTLNAPVNGGITCGGINLGNECTYTCDSGYYLSGTGFGTANDKTTCQRTPTTNSDGLGSWSPAPPATCLPIKCPKLSAPPNGAISCAGDGEDIGNDCTYICDSGYFLSGTGFGPSNDKTTCGTNATSTANGVGVWSPTPPPNCSPINCPVVENPTNGVVSCSNDARLGSICSYTCNSGYYLSGTGFGASNGQSTCESTEESTENGVGRWNPSPPPTCEPITCTTLTAPDNGGITCGGNNIGNECSYTCDSGYFLSGTGFGPSNDKTTCQTTPTSNSDGRGSWSPTPPPTCQQISCPALENPTNGAVSCSNDARVGSICSFTCNAGYALTGTGFGASNNQTTCESTSTSTTNGVGIWNPSPPPTCEGDCPVAVAPVNGQVFCNDNNNVGSVCTYSCNDGYVIDNGADPSPATRTQTCERGGYNGSGGASWNPSTATTCKPVGCDPLPAPGNGTISCTNGEALGSDCTYACNQGYYLVGNNPPRVATASESTRQCVTGSSSSESGKGVWDPSPAPTCQPIVCNDATKFPNTILNCTEDNNLNSVCKYSCVSNFKPVRDIGKKGDTMTCSGPPDRLTGKGSWSERQLLPLCEPISCVNLLTIQNGQAKCDTYHVGETCTFECNPGFKRIGVKNTTCFLRPTPTDQYNAEWNNKVEPSCEKPCTPAYSTQAYNADLNAGIVCTNANNFQSECTFTCAGEFFTEQGENIQRLQCESTGGPAPAWFPTDPQPCTLDGSLK